MDKDTRNAIERATQRARKLLEEDFAAQLEGDFDVHQDGTVAAKPGPHLTSRQVFQRERIVAAIEHKRAAGMTAAEAVRDYLRDAAFTTLNRFVALKMLEARGLVQECITKGEQSAGYREFCGMAPGLVLLPDSAGYRIYIESLFDELSTEVKVLFDRRDPSSVLWPKRPTFEQLLEILNSSELARVWGEDETIGWVYQYFNGQDERRKMREESQAPRNSRELAVRNQFFTPRYVVQFLTDNTLGRIWYEMRGTKTVLAEKCEYLVRKPDEEFAPRAKKDPRDLRVLDPACGSGHFLLYAFDLLLPIYEEAHADPESPKSEATGKTLAEDYPNLDALRRAVPGLVLAHNLHGVDIDPRCAQIAQLALWMRAQKAYRDFGIGRGDRPQIRRSNIVVAEPLAADEQIAKEFVAKLGDVELGRVFMSLVESLRLAGDLGVLLRVEKHVKAPARKQGDFFAPPEERIRAALDRFVGEAAGATNTRRRLFADDTAHGVGLLSVAEKKFDVVLMNPPFGDGTIRARKNLESSYPRTKNDIYAVFVERGIELLVERGLVGAITSRTGFFLTSFQQWREEIILANAPPAVFADLGLGVMDAALVEAAAYCLERSPSTKGRRTVFLRVLEELEDKASALRVAVLRPNQKGTHRRFDVAPVTFSAVPGSPFAYWVSDALRGIFQNEPAFEAAHRECRQGLATADDFRFVRLWWEIAMRDSLGTPAGKWFPYAKGGPYSPFYFDLHLMVNWQAGGIEIIALTRPGSDRPASRPQNTGYFLRPGLTWPRRTKSELSFRVMPRGCVFGDKGPAAFVHQDAPQELLSTLALATSKAFRSLVEFQLAAADAKAGGAARSYEVGVIQRTPLPRATRDQELALARAARQAWSVKRLMDSSIETSHAFALPDGLNARVREVNRESMEAQIDALQQEIDDAAFRLYRIGTEDRAAIEASFNRAFAPSRAAAQGEESEELGESNAGQIVQGGTDVSLVSWLMGVAFARFDPRLATGERAIPPEPEPFAPLPPRSPGMYPEGEEPADRPDILVDDEGHADDLTARVIAIAERVKVNAPENLRAWLAKDFFPLHIKMYSKSRRKAPIYWQLATPSASYSVWLYIHAFSRDTLFRVQNDYVAPKLAHEERRLESLRGELRDGATASQRKQLAEQEAFVEELRAFLDEVKRVAPLWNPNLDDGVIINFAPLWRLVPQNKSWQKELKSTWDALCAGKYDWAHLAMHLWPERVVPKCANDRSLAIAHGLEDVFWVEGSDGKWTARKTPTRSIDELVRERTSPAVKAALKSLLEATVGNGKRAGRKGDRRRKTVAAAQGGYA
ncbi:MAG: BREX-1 system adenine-specific DNA-methyltransferase PglX [Steroidobacteraceae bacterium]|nr:BREX-1 system adenine-specific DNA-methyltransferase PglX [Steroidobacteraceae bacterium]